MRRVHAIFVTVALLATPLRAACARGLRRDGLRLHVLSSAKVAFIDGPASARQDVMRSGHRAETGVYDEREASSTGLRLEYAHGSHGAAVLCVFSAT